VRAGDRIKGARKQKRAHRKTQSDLVRIRKESLEEVNKGVWGMPRLSEAKKDVISCDKLRGGANSRYIRRFPNGATRCTEGTSPSNRSKPRELKHLSTWRKRKQFSDCASSGERTRKSPNLFGYGQAGVIGPRHRLQ
jgi:hypothetical protein